jgi:hypothetical protein
VLPANANLYRYTKVVTAYQLQIGGFGFEYKSVFQVSDDQLLTELLDLTDQMRDKFQRRVDEGKFSPADVDVAIDGLTQTIAWLVDMVGL